MTGFCFLTAQSFKCYQCGERKGESYTKDECEKVQTTVECAAHLKLTCFKQHIIKDDDTEIEKRGCRLISDCEKEKKECEKDAENDKEKIKECAVACCITEGDKPCNGAITVSIDLMMVVVAVVSSLAFS